MTRGISAAQKRAAQLAPEQEALAAALEAREGEQADAAEVVESAEWAWREAEDERVGLAARLRSLEALERDHVGLDEPVRAALAVPGVAGTVASLIAVPPQEEAMALGLLGAVLSCVVVPDVATAERVAAAVEGPVGVLIADADPADGEPEEGLAARFGTTPLARRALGRLLGAAGAWDDLPAAWSAWRESGGRQVRVGAPPAVVTTGGEVLLGERGAAGRAALQRRRDIAELRTAVEQAAEAVADQRAAFEDAREELAEADGAVRAARDALAAGARRLEDARGAVRLAERRAAQVRELRERQDRGMRVIGGDLAQVGRDLEQLQVQGRELRAALDASDGREGRLRGGLELSREKVEEARRVFEQHRRERGEQQTELARLIERASALEGVVAERAAAVPAAQARITEAAAEIARSTERQESVGADIAAAQAELERVGAEQAQVRKALETAERALSGARQELRAREREQKRLSAALSQARASVAELTAAVARMDGEQTRLALTLEERYAIDLGELRSALQAAGHLTLPLDAGVELEGLPKGAAPEQELLADRVVRPESLSDRATVTGWLEGLGRARAGLDKLPQVNLLALEQYREERTAWEQMDSQRADVAAAVEALRDGIARCDALSSERFIRTFKLIDGHFREIYPRLVGGGSANLALTDEGDPLNAGVRLLAQPPGKRLQSLRLLSGGEKAMVAIALLFALFRARPTPFCLLDEVDAPLDEANGARFNAVLREMAALSQFIVITHNKKTMEAADTLYCLTGSGISRLLTIPADLLTDP